MFSLFLVWLTCACNMGKWEKSRVVIVECIKYQRGTVWPHTNNGSAKWCLRFCGANKCFKVFQLKGTQFLKSVLHSKSHFSRHHKVDPQDTVMAADLPGEFQNYFSVPMIRKNGAGCVRHYWVQKNGLVCMQRVFSIAKTCIAGWHYDRMLCCCQLGTRQGKWRAKYICK